MVVGLVVIATALEPDPAQTLQVVAELGPLDGWRCLREATYTYDPRWPHFAPGLLSEAPEAVLTGVDVSRVEIDLRSGEAVVSGTVADQGRVTVLTPGRLQLVGPSCASHLGDWRIIGQHATG